jgi:hypothetical protein
LNLSGARQFISTFIILKDKVLQADSFVKEHTSDNQLFQNSKVDFEPLLLSDPWPVE